MTSELIEKTVNKKDVSDAFYDLGIRKGDTLLIHTSLRSFGKLENSALTVIDGIRDVLTSKGTLIVPTLCQEDFRNSYKTWHLDKKSDVGYLTEYFRKLPDVIRSDHATHSVAAWGKEAEYYTNGHASHGPRACPFGEYAFADSSPWYKLWKSDGYVAFLGVDMTYFTLKHLIEGEFVETLLKKIENEEKRDALKKELMTFDSFPDGFWPFYSSKDMQAVLEAKGMVRKTTCGKAEIIAVKAKEAVDTTLAELLKNPEKWYSGEVLQWIEKARG